MSDVRRCSGCGAENFATASSCTLCGGRLLGVASVRTTDADAENWRHRKNIEDGTRQTKQRRLPPGTTAAIIAGFAVMGVIVVCCGGLDVPTIRDPYRDCRRWGKSDSYIATMSANYGVVKDVGGLPKDEILRGSLDACIDRVTSDSELAECRACMKEIIGDLFER